MKALLVVGLVLLLLTLALPFAMGMGMGEMERCPACSAPDTAFAVAMCLAILGLSGVFMRLALSGRVSQRASSTPRFLPVVDLDRPPQHA